MLPSDTLASSIPGDLGIFLIINYHGLTNRGYQQAARRESKSS